MLGAWIIYWLAFRGYPALHAIPLCSGALSTLFFYHCWLTCQSKVVRPTLEPQRGEERWRLQGGGMDTSEPSVHNPVLWSLYLLPHRPTSMACGVECRYCVQDWRQASSSNLDNSSMHLYSLTAVLRGYKGKDSRKYLLWTYYTSFRSRFNIVRQASCRRSVEEIHCVLYLYFMCEMKVYSYKFQCVLSFFPCCALWLEHHLLENSLSVTRCHSWEMQFFVTATTDFAFCFTSLPNSIWRCFQSGRFRCCYSGQQPW